MLVRHYMTRDLIVLTPEVRCRQAMLLMRANRIRRAPVVEGGRLAGIVTERDLLRILPGRLGELEGGDEDELTGPEVREIMCSDVVFVPGGCTLERVAALMLAHKIGGVPVVDEGRLVGMVTESDVFRAFIRLMAPGVGVLATIQAPAPEGSAPPQDAVRIAQVMGLRLTALTTQDLPGAPALQTLRVSGERQGEFMAELERRGFRIYGFSTGD